MDDLSPTLSPSVIQSLALDNPNFEGFDSQGGLLELSQMTDSQLTTLFKYGLFTGYSYFLQAPDQSAKLADDLAQAGGSSALFGGSFAVVASAGERELPPPVPPLTVGESPMIPPGTGMTGTPTTLPGTKEKEGEVRPTPRERGPQPVPTGLLPSLRSANRFSRWRRRRFWNRPFLRKSNKEWNSSSSPDASCSFSKSQDRFGNSEPASVGSSRSWSLSSWACTGPFFWNGCMMRTWISCANARFCRLWSMNFKITKTSLARPATLWTTPTAVPFSMPTVRVNDPFPDPFRTVGWEV